jgi:hypothetical protein
VEVKQPEQSSVLTCHSLALSCAVRDGNSTASALKYRGNDGGARRIDRPFIDQLVRQGVTYNPIHIGAYQSAEEGSVIARPNATRSEQYTAVPIDVQTPGAGIAASPSPRTPPTHRVKVGSPQNLCYNAAKCLVQPDKAQATCARARCLLLQERRDRQAKPDLVVGSGSYEIAYRSSTAAASVGYDILLRPFLRGNVSFYLGAVGVSAGQGGTASQIQSCRWISRQRDRTLGA